MSTDKRNGSTLNHTH